LIEHLSKTIPENVNLELNSLFKEYEINSDEDFPVKVCFSKNGVAGSCRAKFIVGADGAYSQVAKFNKNLQGNKKFLVGFEKLFYGTIDFGPCPESCVYHFWFGDFSLGYGGWLSPTIYKGKPAFRVGIAKLLSDANNLHKVDEFIKILHGKGIIKFEHKEPVVTFAHPIPIGGVLKNVYDKYCLLIGDAAGFCGAFAADGIKGAVLSAQIAAELIPKHLSGDHEAFSNYFDLIQKRTKMMTYYKKQLIYRWMWNVMKSNRTFHALINIISKEKQGFLHQFCDNKDKNKSLFRVVLKLKHLWKLMKYAVYMFVDLFKRRKG
jgi:flavin-dependent dehydrogenase